MSHIDFQNILIDSRAKVSFISQSHILSAVAPNWVMGAAGGLSNDLMDPVDARGKDILDANHRRDFVLMEPNGT